MGQSEFSLQELERAVEIYLGIPTKFLRAGGHYLYVDQAGLENESGGVFIRWGSPRWPFKPIIVPKR